MNQTYELEFVSPTPTVIIKHAEEERDRSVKFRVQNSSFLTGEGSNRVSQKVKTMARLSNARTG